MRDNTPYAQPPAVLARKAACMEWVFRGAPPVEHVLEAFGGLGVTTEIISRALPEASVTSVEIDPSTYDKARHRAFRSKWVLGDATDVLRTWAPEGTRGVSLDFNQFTLLDLGGRLGWRTDVVLAALALRPVWLQLTDTAVGKLHLHWRRYGLEGGDCFTYLDALDHWFRENAGLGITRFARRSVSCYLLLEKTRDFVSLEWRENPDDVAGVQLFERR